MLHLPEMTFRSNCFSFYVLFIINTNVKASIEVKNKIISGPKIKTGYLTCVCGYRTTQYRPMHYSASLFKYDVTSFYNYSGGYRT